MTFFILSLVSALDPYQPSSFAVELDMGVCGWYQCQYGKCHVMIWKIPCHNLLITYFSLIFFQALSFILQKRSLNWQIAKLNPEESSLCSSCKYFFFESGFKKICTMTLESVCKIYPRRWHLNGNFYSTRRIHIWANYSVSSSLNFIPVFWNVLIWLKYDYMYIFMHHHSLYFDI